LIVVIVLVGAFALLVTVHLAIVVGLAARSCPWRAVVALVVPPLAPYWAARSNMGVRAGVWLACGALYATARVLAFQ
jgi:hypothetical protein